MRSLRRIWDALLFDSYGNIALAAFIVCSVSGIFLAVPYDVTAAYDSLALITITNLPAVIFRNLHYWSAQVFLVFTLLHTWEQFASPPSADVGHGKWFRLTCSLAVAFFVMLSGFILKGDAESMQAGRILGSLLAKVPLSGDLLVASLLGPEGDLQLVYVHHIATATLILLYILFEHIGTIWTSRKTFLIVLSLTTLLAFLIHPPLHDGLHPVLKGPWYFVGLQEIMHWTANPAWIWLLVLVPLLLVYLFFHAGDRSGRVIRRIMAFLAAGYLILTLTGYFFRGENWEWQVPWQSEGVTYGTGLDVGLRLENRTHQEITSADIPVVRGHREACLVCHPQVTGFSPAHDPSALGCSSCHLGNPLTLEKERAHRNMILVPGNLGQARQTCGTAECHPDIPGRVESSLMTTNSGLVSVDRHVFGETGSPDGPAHINALGHGPADTHLRNLCSNCHLGREKTRTGPIDQLSRGGGCTACHLNYSAGAERQHAAYLEGGREEALLPLLHPSLDIRITNDHCFGCHSRSGRISTSYEGWHETLLEAEDLTVREGYRILQDQRVFRFISADVHHTAGLTCIDCHTSFGIMGDGRHYPHKEEAVKIRCEDCHIAGEPDLLGYGDLDPETRKIFDLRTYGDPERKMLAGKSDGKALVHTEVWGDSIFLSLKLSGKRLAMSPPAASCRRDHGHSRLSCSSCHSSWAPTCIGCHNAFEPETPGYDLYEDKETRGTWVEYVGVFEAEPPGLGMRTTNDGEVQPAIPGMIMTIDRSGFPGALPRGADAPTHRRLYAPASPHTTSSKGRSCRSCHNDPAALGYGRGSLTYEVDGGTGRWEFIPRYAIDPHDGLPEDAWTGFLTELPGLIPLSTRGNFRPFTPEEQKRILTVGACLHCHDENSVIMKQSLEQDFRDYLGKITADCILPSW